MKSIEIVCDNLSKIYSGKVIFKNLSLKLSSGNSVSILGKNGSGKSTLIKILSGIISANKGSITVSENNIPVPGNLCYTKIGLISPYLNLYDELTAYENLKFFCGLKNNSDIGIDEKINFYLNRVKLFDKRNETVKNFSSGMKQKLKLIFAVINEPGILYMDEPGTNLDSEGIDIVYETAEEHKKNGILVVATNDKEDIKLCERSINIEDYK
ncbi:MAG TPA: ABC transporter ATP-binding protein [Ignavibacteria bacterium]|nr:ABC transporter ATP-binding protein [Bacteroidota bacterium]HRI84726.1 ABC transporter ATP-binding protein [Ignavibacteria bacterium]HRK00516.1 ABC transporter ATP-binding protein [Ignavibacteria bacterium]